MTVRCGECGGRIDRPGLSNCDVKEHRTPTVGEAIIRAVENELSNRKGMSWGGIDDEILDELRDKLAVIADDLIYDMDPSK